MGVFSTIMREHSEFSSPKDGETVSRPVKKICEKVNQEVQLDKG